MILGNVLMRCDLAPDAVYQWFMERISTPTTG